MSVCRFSDRRVKGEMEFLKGINFGLNSQFFLTAKKNQNVKSRVFDEIDRRANNPARLASLNSQMSIRNFDK